MSENDGTSGDGPRAAPHQTRYLSMALRSFIFASFCARHSRVIAPQPGVYTLSILNTRQSCTLH